MLDKETKLKATEITAVTCTDQYIIVRWVNEYIGFGEFVCDYDYNVVDDECMGKAFSEYMIEQIKMQLPGRPEVKEKE